MDYLEHHGIKGQKWGVRRFQNTNGAYTVEGKKKKSANHKITKQKVANAASTAFAVATMAAMAYVTVEPYLKSNNSTVSTGKSWVNANDHVTVTNLFTGKSQHYTDYFKEQAQINAIPKKYRSKSVFV